MIQFLRGNKAQLNSSINVIADGQPVFEKDTGQLKIGNGVNLFKDLPYVGISNSGEESYDMNSGYVDLTSQLRLSWGYVKFPEIQESQLSYLPFSFTEPANINDYTSEFVISDYIKADSASVSDIHAKLDILAVWGSSTNNQEVGIYKVATSYTSSSIPYNDTVRVQCMGPRKQVIGFGLSAYLFILSRDPQS